MAKKKLKKDEKERKVDEVNQENSEEENEKEVIEMILGEEKIEELISKLNELKNSNTHMHFDTGFHELLIYHREGAIE